MASILKRLRNLGKQKISGVLDKYEDDLFALKEEISKNDESEKKIKESLYSIKGSRELVLKEKTKTESLIPKLEAGIKKSLADNNEKLAKEAFEKLKSLKSKLATYDKTIETYDDAIEKIQLNLNNIEKKIKSAKLKLSELESKKQFSENVDKLNNTVKEINSILGGIDESDNIHVQNIEKKYAISQMKLEDINSVDDVQLLLDETDIDFEDYKKSIMEEEDKNELVDIDM